MKIRQIILAASLTLPFAGTSFANDVNIVSGDSTLYSELCVTAVEQPQVFERKLRDLRISRSALACNGKDVDRFVDSIRGEAPVALRPGANDVATKLCVAAATSSSDYDEIAREFGVRDASAVTCNNKPLAEFVREFSGAASRS